MTLLKNDPLTQLAFSIYENPGVFSILIGSGISRSAEIPTGWEITLDLIRRVALAQGVTDSENWAQWYREKTGAEPNYSVLLEDIASSPIERRSILHSYIEPTATEREEGKKIPTSAHHAIAKMVRAGYIRVIITTNFDRLMENALREEGIEPTVVYSEDSLLGAEPLTHSQCYLLKIHGDYKDARILNTDSELSEYPADYNKVLDRIFDEHGLVICGWSGEWDIALRAAILRSPNRRYPVFWTTLSELKGGAKELASHKHAKSVTISTADAFFSTLQQRIEILEKSHRQNPQSVSLLVNSAKRFLSKPEYRIQLEELVSEEVSGLLGKLDALDFSPHESFTQEILRSRVQHYEALTESLARVLGVLGRWGDGSELPIVVDTIRTLYNHARKVGNGLQIWLGLRSYPAVLTFITFGLGLLKSQKWHDLHQFFNSTVMRDHRDPISIVSCFYLGGWEGGRNDLWQNLEGYKDLKTALDDHLLKIMGEWQNSFCGVEPNFELLYERFGTFAALAVFESNDLQGLEDAANNSSGKIFARMPVGRVGWHTESHKSILFDLDKEATKIQLLETGFAKGQRRMLELFTENFKRYCDQMSW